MVETFEGMINVPWQGKLLLEGRCFYLNISAAHSSAMRASDSMLVKLHADDAAEVTG